MFQSMLSFESIEYLSLYSTRHFLGDFVIKKKTVPVGREVTTDVL